MTDADTRLREAEARFPVGRRVRFYPLAGLSRHELTRVSSKPWAVGFGVIMIAVECRKGGVLIDHLEVI
jgi:hypothetical protein